jgi:serine/threonine protein kinase
MSASSVTLTAGSILDGKYEIVGVLGVGGMGEVYKAKHLHLNALRCIKTMKRELASDEGFRARFIREARLATMVHHSNVALVHDFAISDQGASYLVTEFIDGITLRQWAAQHGRFPVGLAIDIVAQVLAGLHEIHKQGLVHRDISAENIMIFYDEERWIAKIIDLGIAKALEAPMSERTQVGLFVGNPRYSSPEQLGELAEGEELDARADIYSLGVVLYEMVIGAPPFTSRTPQGYILSHLRNVAPSFEKALPGSEWPEGFEKAVFKALEKDRRDRYGSAREFARALRPFVTVSSRTVEREMAEVIGSLTPPPVTNSDLTMQLARAQAAPTEEVEAPTIATPKEELGLRRTQRDPVHDTAGREDEAWAAAESEESPEAWQRFIDRYPSSPRIPEARMSRDEIRAFDVAAMIDSVEEWQRFLESFPAARRRETALERHADALERVMRERFDEAVRIDSEQGYDAFLDEFGDAAISDQIREMRAELIERSEAMEKEDVAALEAFFERWPESRKREEVSAILATLHSRDAVAAAFRQASSENTPEALRRFIAEHHETVYVVPANALLGKWEEAAYERFVDAHDPRGLDDFLRSFPDGKYAVDARAIAALWKSEAKARAAWDRVARADSPKIFRHFAAEHPGTEHAKRALKRATDLEALADIKSAESVGDSSRIRVISHDFDSTFIGREADAALTRLRVREANRLEETAWETAWREGTTAAFLTFLENFPGSSHFAEARAAMREAEIFELAVKENKLALFKAFLHDFPEGRHFAEAKIRAARLREGGPAQSTSKDAADDGVVDRLRKVFGGDS